MSRQSSILCLLLFASSIVVKAQKFMVHVEVCTDENVAVNNCSVNVKGTSLYFPTNKYGKINFSSTLIKDKKFKIAITDIRYQAFEKEYDLIANSVNTDTLSIKIILEPFEWGTVDIYSKPQIIYENKKLNVQDFEFMGDRLLLLTYEKRPGHHTRLVLCDEKNTTISAYYLDNNINKIEKDYEGKIHIASDDMVMLVSIYQDQIYVMKEDKNSYDSFLKPLLYKSEDQIYFSNYAWHYPGFNYYAFNTTDSSYKTLKYVEDKFMMDMYRAEYKYVDTRMKLEAYRQQERTGVDKEIWAAIWNGFPNSLYYKPLYAPMFVRNDSVMLFDHYSNQIFYFDESNNLLDSVSINYHLGKEATNWKKQLMMDDVTKKIYNVFEKNGTYTLVELNACGRSVATINLAYKYPEKMKVHNGAVYFNYRPFESQQNKYLYKQVIK